MTEKDIRLSCPGCVEDTTIKGAYLCKVLMLSPLKVYCEGSNECERIKKWRRKADYKGMRTILDACCGARKCWYDKHNPDVVYMDNRKEVCTLSDGRTLEVKPDIVADFRHMPFSDNSFSLVLFDPPHYRWCGDNSNLKKNYGRLPKDWGNYVGQGFDECMRVLKENGFLVFKWNDQQIKLKTIMKYIKFEPLFGHLTGRSGHTHWLVFMKGGEK